MIRYNAKGICALAAAMINRALGDVKGSPPYCRKIETDRAMAFILSDSCEAWCLELDIDYRTLRGKAAVLYRQFLEREDQGGSNRRPGRLYREGLRPGRKRLTTLMECRKL